MNRCKGKWVALSQGSKRQIEMFLPLLTASCKVYSKENAKFGTLSGNAL